MTRDDICNALASYLKVMVDTPWGDAVADLLALAWPDSPPAPLMGFGDPLAAILPTITAILSGRDYLARKNDPVAATFREEARAIRAALAIVESRS